MVNLVKLLKMYGIELKIVPDPYRDEIYFVFSKNDKHYSVKVDLDNMSQYPISMEDSLIAQLTILLINGYFD